MCWGGELLWDVSFEALGKCCCGTILVCAVEFALHSAHDDEEDDEYRCENAAENESPLREDGMGLLIFQ